MFGVLHYTFCSNGFLRAGVVALLRIPCTEPLLKADDFFLDCASIITSSALEPALGIIALSAAATAPADPSFRVQAVAGPPVVTDVKVSICVDQQAEGTGVQPTPKTTIKRNASQESCGV